MEDLWILVAKKLSGEASPEELLELEQALRKEPDLHYSLQFIIDSWNKKQAPATEPTEAAWDRHEAMMRRTGQFPEGQAPLPADLFPPARHPRIFTPFALLCALVLVFGIIYLAVRPKPVTVVPSETLALPHSEVITQNGTRTKLLLPDGTDVWLNAGSRLTYDSSYGSKLREVTLTGEAFFDVLKNREKPFVIHTGIINIRVLGTAFNVKSYPGDKTVETSLIRGRIEVTYAGDAPGKLSSRKLILNPNQKLIVDRAVSAETFDAVAAQAETPAKKTAGSKTEVLINSLHYFGPDSVVSETAWVDNKLVFQDESFHDLAEKMQRWYSVKMIFDEPRLDSLHFTGSFEKENIQQALKALQLLSRFNFEIRNAEVHIRNIP